MISIQKRFNTFKNDPERFNTYMNKNEDEVTAMFIYNKFKKMGL